MTLDDVSMALDLTGLILAIAAAALVFARRDRIPGSIAPIVLAVLLVATIGDHLLDFAEDLAVSAEPWIIAALDAVEDSVDFITPLVWWFFFYSVLQAAVLSRARESEERLRFLTEQIPAVLWATDANLRFTLSTGSALKGLGLEPGQVVGLNLFEYFQTDDPDFPPIAHHRDALDGQGGSYDTEWAGRTFQTFTQPLRDDSGDITGTIGVALDVTARTDAEERLRQSEQSFRSIFEQAAVGVAMLDSNTGMTLQANRRYCEILGTLENSPVGKTWMELTHPDDLAEDLARMEQLRSGAIREFSLQKRLTTAEDEFVWINLTVSPMWPAGEEPTTHIAIIEDITEQKRIHRALSESEARYRVLTEHAGEAIVIVDADTGEFVDANARALEMFKVSLDDLKQLGPAGTSPPLQTCGTPSGELVQGYLQQALECDEFVFEWLHLDSDSRVFPTEVRLVRLPDEKRRLLRGAATDITERKRIEAERESFIAQLEQKNAELERFTYTVSHDLKSPLITITGFLGLLRQDIESDCREKVDEDMAEIATAVDRMKRLLDELLELSRIGRVANPIENVAPQDLVQEAVESLESEINEHETRLVIADNLPPVQGDRGRLVEVFQNLIQNAVKFSASQSQPQVEIGVWHENDETVFFVRDNGIGIAPQYHERVFSLFEQLTPQADGTGIGLAIVKRIVEVHGGWIRIESDGEGHGTTVCFTLAPPGQ